MPIIMSVCMCVPVSLCALYQEHPSKVRFVSRPLEVPLLRPINAGNHPITPSYPTITRPIRAKRSQGAGWICQGVTVSCFTEHVYRVFREITAQKPNPEHRFTC